MKGKIQTDRAKAIGRLLFQKYDLGKRGALGPKQCYEIFSDFCYRILSIHPQPTMEDANSMYDVLDDNKDKKVTESDFQALAVRYLCQSNSGISSSFIPSTSQANQYGSQYGSSKQISSQNSSNSLKGSNVSRYTQSRQQTSTGLGKNLSVIARKRVDVARRLFKKYDKDESGYLAEDEIPLIIQQTYKQMGQAYQPSREDVKSYLKMVDTDGDGKITLSQFEEIILKSLKNAGFQIYE